MVSNGTSSGLTRGHWMKKLEDLPQPPELTSERVRDLLSKALLAPATVTCAEIQELAASVTFHLIQTKNRENGPTP